MKVVAADIVWRAVTEGWNSGRLRRELCAHAARCRN
jgi:hypothetical protein